MPRLSLALVALALLACADRLVADDHGDGSDGESGETSATASASSTAADTTGASTATTGATAATNATTGASSATTVDPDGGDDGPKLDVGAAPPDLPDDPLDCEDPPLEMPEGECGVLVPFRGPRIVQACVGWNGRDVGCPPPDDPSVVALFFACIDECSMFVGETCGPWTNQTDVCCYWSAYEPAEVC